MLGSTIRHLRDLARDHGFEAKAFRAEPDGISDIGYPLIAHMRFVHFVVVEQIGKDVVHINDPASGPMILERTKFDSDFTGIVLTLEPRTVARRGSSFSFPRGLLLAWKAQWILLATAAVMSLGGGVAAAAGIWWLVAADGSTTHGMMFLAASAGAGMISTLATETASFRVRQLRSADVFAALGRAANGHYLFSRPEQTLDQFAALDRVQDANLPSALLATVWLFAAMALGAALAPASVFPVAIAASIQIGLVAGASIRRGSRLARYGHAKVSAHGIDADHLAGSGWYRVGGAGDALFASLAGAHARTASEVFKAAAERARLRMLLLALDLAKFTALLVVVEPGEMADLVLALSLAAASTAGVHRIGRDFPAPALKEALLRLDDLPSAQAPLQSPPPEQPDQAFRMDKAGWQPEGGRSVVADISVAIAPGEMLVVHGPSGAGATTFARLASGMLEPTSGSVTLYGRGLSAHEPATATLVDHTCHLLPGNLRDNLCLGAEDIDDEDMLTALRVVDLHDIIETRGGLAFVLKSDQPRLSGGQLRRVAIARALCRWPRILVLDQTLDSVEVTLANTILRRIRSYGIIVIVTTKNLELFSAGDHRLDLADAQTA